MTFCSRHPTPCVPFIRCDLSQKLPVQFALFVRSVSASKTGIYVSAIYSVNECLVLLQSNMKINQHKKLESR
jgi:hypothetical protein